ncbi:MAG TPA: hypothetical protein PKC72_00090 [Chitinophagaceae bacterium]|nr:hypothetical protein [Chitinophagaceae bacterium]
MKKALLICSLFVAFGCAENNAEKKQHEPETKQQQEQDQGSGDVALQEWMKGKLWTAEETMAPMALLKLKTDGTYELKTNNHNDTWKIKNGELSLSMLTEWPVEKVNDTTFRLHVKPSDTWFTYKYSGNLE